MVILFLSLKKILTLISGLLGKLMIGKLRFIKCILQRLD